MPSKFDAMEFVSRCTGVNHLGAVHCLIGSEKYPKARLSLGFTVVDSWDVRLLGYTDDMVDQVPTVAPPALLITSKDD